MSGHPRGKMLLVVSEYLKFRNQYEKSNSSTNWVSENPQFRIFGSRSRLAYYIFYAFTFISFFFFDLRYFRSVRPSLHSRCAFFLFEKICDEDGWSKFKSLAFWAFEREKTSRQLWFVRLVMYRLDGIVLVTFAK